MKSIITSISFFLILAVLGYNPAMAQENPNNKSGDIVGLIKGQDTPLESYEILVRPESSTNNAISRDDDDPIVEIVDGALDTTNYDYEFYHTASTNGVNLVSAEIGNEIDQNDDRNGKTLIGNESIYIVELGTESIYPNPAANNYLNPAVNIYPNPVADRLTIDFGQEAHLTIMVMNNGGSVNYQVNGKMSYHTVDVSSFEPGIYYVCLITEYQKVTHKIVVVH